MRHTPSLPYNGLTIVIDKPSRFDHSVLLSGTAGSAFDSALKLPRQACDIRLVNTLHEGWLPNTKVVLLLGDSYRAYQQGVTLNQLRGAPWIHNGVVFMASYAPQDAFDRRAYFDDTTEEEDTTNDVDEKGTKGATQRKNFLFWLRQDLHKAKRILSDGLRVVEFPPLELCRVDTLIEELRTISGENLYLDIETDSQLRLTCVGWKFPGRPVRCAPMWQTQRPSMGYLWGTLTTARFLAALAVAMANNTVVVHNSMFDLFVLAWRYGVPPGKNIIDTMLLHNRILLEVEKSLGHCLSLYTDQPYHKSDGVFEPHNDAQAMQLYNYNAKDVQSLEVLLERIREAAAHGYAHDSGEVATSLVRPYLLATLQGLRLNVDKVRGQMLENDAKKVQLRRVLKMLCGYELNPNSYPQVGQYLYDKDLGMGYKKPVKDPTNEKQLLQLRLKHNNPAITAFLEYRHCTKENGQLKFNFYPGASVLKTYDAPRLTTSYNIAGTKTMRLSSRTLLRRFGTNIQNLPKHLRKMILPDDGKVFVQVDQAGAEALIVAYLCDHRRYREMFLQNIKPHVYVALRLFREIWEVELGFSLADYVNAPLAMLKTLPRWNEITDVIKASDEWPASKRYYFIAKQVSHSSNYGVKAPSLRMNTLLKSEGKVALTLDQAQRFLNIYHEQMFPEITAWHVDVAQEVYSKRLLRNLFGHPWQITSLVDDSMLKECYAFKPQSTVGMITNMAFKDLQDQVEEGKLPAGVDVLQNNHDSVLLQCFPGDVQTVVTAAQRAINRPLVSPRAELFYMKSEASVGDNWGQMKEFKPQQQKDAQHDNHNNSRGVN